MSLLLGRNLHVAGSLSLQHTNYVEDCEICCHPIDISYGFEDQNLLHFQATTPEGDPY